MSRKIVTKIYENLTTSDYDQVPSGSLETVTRRVCNDDFDDTTDIKREIIFDFNEIKSTKEIKFTIINDEKHIDETTLRRAHFKVKTTEADRASFNLRKEIENHKTNNTVETYDNSEISIPVRAAPRTRVTAVFTEEKQTTAVPYTLD
jgi:NDP-sugar pyrophosphorylase family protein